jgi:hypothetical protein
MTSVPFGVSLYVSGTTPTKSSTAGFLANTEAIIKHKLS